MSLTLDLLKQRQLEKQNKNIYSTKKIESEILIELKEKLEEHLLENDRVMLEINPRVVSAFMNILTDSILAIYEYEQVDSNKFIFSNKEITF
jgi:hypothetical protein